MFSSERILTLNVGAHKILLAEFSISSGKPPMLLNYGTADLGADPDSDGTTVDRLPYAIREVMKVRGMRSAPVMLSLSGQMVFPRFVRLPAVGADKLLQMVQYELEQNVPFPMDEIVWNHQFIGDDSSGEQGAMIVAAKIESVRAITDSVVTAGLEPEIVDVAPMALYNTLRYNYPELDGCTVLLDIGARSTNLIIVEEEKIYTRCIPVAGNSITQELARSLGVSFGEAENIKQEIGFVALGGVFASEDESAERVSKIVRNVVTRLHAEINRSINFYRSQQGGSAPLRMLLTGGSSVLPHLDTFFKDKMQVEVEHLNPFINVGLGNRVNVEQVGADAFIMAESVGLALRRSLACPIEINLMPPDLVKRKSMKRRLPFFGLAAAGVLLSLGVWTMYARQMANLYTFQNEQVAAKLGVVRQTQSRMQAADKERAVVQDKADALADLMEERTAWLRYVEAVRKSLLDGMWLTELLPLKNPAGKVVGISMVGRGWADKMKGIEEQARSAGRSATAVEELRDQLRHHPCFGKGTQDIRIVGQKDIGAYLIEFTIEAQLAKAGTVEDTKEP